MKYTFYATSILCPLLVSCDLLFGTQPPDVLILTIDTLRVDHVSAFSSESPAQTPVLDALADDGVSYTNAYSPISVTGPAFVSLMTGLPISEHNVTMNVFRGGTSLSKDYDTLAEAFKQNEYRTGGFVSGFTLRPSLGLSQGFNVYDAPSSGGNRRWGDLTAKKAIQWLSRKDTPAFLWYHTYDAHGPWDRWGTSCSKNAHTEEELETLDRIPKYQRLGTCIDEQEYQTRYAKSVEFADANVGLIIASLKEQGRYDDALIIVTADHGESFTERELWFDHGTTPHEEQLHVPLIIKYPRNTKAGTSDDRLVSLLDIAPTVLATADLPKFSKGTGIDLSLHSDEIHPYLFGESSHCKKNPLLSCTPMGPKGKIFALRSPELTIVQSADTMQQFNRIHDPLELKPLPLYSPLSTELEHFSTQRFEQVKDLVWPPPNRRSAEFEQLRKLGYVNE